MANRGMTISMADLEMIPSTAGKAMTFSLVVTKAIASLEILVMTP